MNKSLVSFNAGSVQTLERLFPGESEMAQRMRAMDWSQTQLGPVKSWSPALRMMIGFLLANRFPLLLWWGPQYISIYNDAYRPVLGAKHPNSLGQPASECWKEIWHILQPLIDTPFNGGPATWNEDIFLEMNRHGFVEETHFTIAYSPVPDETESRGIGGVLATVHEITEKVVGERRVRLLRDLGERSAQAKSAEEACAIAAEILGRHTEDIPFAVLYLVDPDRKHAHLAAASGVALDDVAGPAVIDLVGNTSPNLWPLATAAETEELQLVEELANKFQKVPPGPWADQPRCAVVVPIRSNLAHQLAGFLVAGLSSRLRFDEQYRSFLELMSAQIATAIANARAYDEERKRAEALAEIDRTKTVFFSNVSHEFRTPLTLMLGPLEDLLRKPENQVNPENRALAEMAHRNGLRLLKLVNTLLDFSRIEAGRIQASYEPTDLSAFTCELASVFRSAVEKAGLKLVLECPPLHEPVYVDREMWEKIVLNLLSNAFKFTFEGEIRVSLRQIGARVELSVIDTGVGIPAEELPRIFERFHRVQGTRSRTHEGTGIGLSLVQELARLHGGEVKIQSVQGKGTTFNVCIQTGKGHLPADRIVAARSQASTSLNADLFIQDASQWLPEAQVDGLGDKWINHSRPSSPAPDAARILLAEDNADMRGYLQRLLSRHYHVEAVPDGQAALNAARLRLPDLLLADVMMPRLDGFGLLKELRADERTRTIPIIMLSARAGEESRMEGLQSGADDYLAKPFSARELTTRISSQLALARLRRDTQAETVQRLAELEKANLKIRDARRAAINLMEDAVKSGQALEKLNVVLRESEERFRTLSDNIPQLAWIADPGTDGQVHWFNKSWLDYTGKTPEQMKGSGWQTVLHPDHAERVIEKFQRHVRECKDWEDTFPLRRADGQFRWFLSRMNCIRDDSGKVERIFGTNTDVTEQREMENQIKQQAEHLADEARCKDEFLAMLSHELRNPLGPINNATHLLSQMLPDDNKETTCLVEMIKRQVAHMTRLIGDLLDVSRVAKGKISIHKTQIDLREVVRTTVGDHRRILEKSGLSVEISVSDTPIWIDGDATRLAQAVSNVLHNANKFTDVGGTVTVDLTHDRQGGRAILAIRDTGEGIEPKLLPRLFDAFAQGDSSLDRKHSGLGLGLALTKGLIELHGGTVKALSAGKGLGSEFIIEIPVVSTRILKAVSVPESRNADVKRKVLIIEDNVDAAESMQMLLKISGHSVSVATDGPHGLEMAEKMVPEIIFCDIGLPGSMNGYDVAKEIRQRQSLAGVYLIALTGYGQVEDIRRAETAGFNLHLVKPAELGALTDAIAGMPPRKYQIKEALG